MPFNRNSQQYVVKWARLSFPHVWEAKPVVQQGRTIGDPRFSTLLVVPDVENQIAAIQKLEEQLIAASWPEGIPQGITLKRALQRGEIIRPGDDNLKGQWVLSANAKEDSPPQVCVRSHESNEIVLVTAATHRNAVYSGCEAHVSIGLFTSQMSIQTPQINVGLNSILLTEREMSRFDNRVSPSTAFAGIDESGAPPTDAPMPGQQPAQTQTQADEDIPW